MKIRRTKQFIFFESIPYVTAVYYFFWWVLLQHYEPEYLEKNFVLIVGGIVCLIIHTAACCLRMRAYTFKHGLPIDLAYTPTFIYSHWDRGHTIKDMLVEQKKGFKALHRDVHEYNDGEPKPSWLHWYVSAGNVPLYIVGGISSIALGLGVGAILITFPAYALDQVTTESLLWYALIGVLYYFTYNLSYMIYTIGRRK